MDSQSVASMLQQLVGRALDDAMGEGTSPSAAAKHYERVYSYAMTIISSRIALSVEQDEAATAAAIQKRLYQDRQNSNAHEFGRKHNALCSLSGPGTLKKRWALLRLLLLISEDRRRDDAEGQKQLQIAYTPFDAVKEGGLPVLPAKSIESSSPAKANGVPTARNAPRSTWDAAAPRGSDPTGTGKYVLGTNKAGVIREFMELQAQDMELQESDLVRDVLYACQGIDGKYVKLDAEQDAYVVDKMWAVPKMMRTLVQRLCEIGWLYRRVRAYIAESMEPANTHRVGTVGQSFCAGLQQELGDYYRLIAVLEAQAHNPIPDMEAAVGAMDGQGGGNYLSLRRLSVWLGEPLIRMRLMAQLVDSCRGTQGGAMVNLVHMHAQHGGHLARGFVLQLLRQVSAPVFEMARRWVLEGELDDMFGEFFIAAKKDIRDEWLWREGYRLERAMLPSFISVPLALRILRTGKSINFLRRCCQDTGWTAAASEAVQRAAEAAASRGGVDHDDRDNDSAAALSYGAGEALQCLVGEAASRTDAHLLKILFDRYKFREHCLAIKRYLLLGQGDLVTTLMVLVEKDLSESARSISSFGLAGKLEMAVRSSMAYYDDPDVLDRLRVKMMPHTGGELGWDVFSLVYITTPPLTTIFTDEAMALYLRIFNFLWRLKRVEQALSDTWREMKPTAAVGKALASMRVELGRPAKGGAGLRENAPTPEERGLAAALRRCQTQCNEMYHFVTNLQYYIMFEVLETSWTDFEAEMGMAKDLDAVIAAHSKYLSAIVEKALLGDQASALASVLKHIFNGILHFRGIASRLLGIVHEAHMRKERMRRTVQERTNAGKWGTSVDEEGGPVVDAAVLAEIGGAMDKAMEEYSRNLTEFMAKLPLQAHVDLRFLSFRLDFSEFYARKAQGGGGATGKDSTANKQPAMTSRA